MTKFQDQTVRKYLTELGSDNAIPGGGSAAALGGALGASLSLMVARFSVRRQKTDHDKNLLAKLTQALEKLVPQIAEVVDEDPAVFSKVASCYDVQRAADTDGKKRAARILMDQALAEAFQCQAALAFLLVMALRVNDDLEPLASGSVKNDLNVSRSLLRGAFEGAVSTCEINLKYLEDAEKKKVLEQELNHINSEFKTVSHG
ncbi:MAG: cyclodeaminase/cyclohydrolase family protein [Candidatus Omnitrophica bacterium]|nr:cyclodeaminase/cyclohydrolase family protein [Candidatus Omnitrophota bacterium]